MIILDYKDRRPIYEQVSEKFKELMLCGVISENESMPSVRSLAMDLSINPNTIQRAYAELERQGYIYTVKGKGSFAAENTAMKENRRKEILTRPYRSGFPMKRSKKWWRSSTRQQREGRR